MRRRLEEFEKAFYRLMEAVNEAQSELEIDGVIQRFEFTFELAWKALQEHLREEGIICNSPRRCLKEAYKVGLIEDEKVWLKILEDRNLYKVGGRGSELLSPYKGLKQNFKPQPYWTFSGF